MDSYLSHGLTGDIYPIDNYETVAERDPHCWALVCPTDHSLWWSGNGWTTVPEYAEVYTDEERWTEEGAEIPQSIGNWVYVG